MKLSKLKVFQSVKVGSKEHTFLTDADFDMELKDTLVFITRKSDGSKVVTPLTNTPWFVPRVFNGKTVNELEDRAEEVLTPIKSKSTKKVSSEQVKSQKSPSRTRKKGTAKA